MQWVPALVRNALWIRPSVNEEFDTVQFACPGGAVQRRPTLVGGDLDVCPTADEKFYHGSMTKQTGHVQCCTANADVSNHELPEIGL
jgi:hypothetical protein